LECGDRRRRSRALSALCASLSLALAACGGPDTVRLDVFIPDGADVEGMEEAASGPAEPPDTAAGRQLAWVLEVINERSTELHAREIEEHFGEIYISVMTTEIILDVFESLGRDNAPLTFLDISPDTSDTSLLALIEGTQGMLTIGMNIEDVTGKIAVIQFIQLAELLPVQ
jgi:ORF 12 gene product N-terminal